MKILKIKDSQGVWHDVPAIVGRQGNQGPSGTPGTPGVPGPQGPDNVYIGTNPPSTAKVWINPEGEPTPTETGIDFVDFTITPVSSTEFTVEASLTPAEVLALVEDPDKQVVGRATILGLGYKCEGFPFVMSGEAVLFPLSYYDSEWSEYLIGEIRGVEDADEWTIMVGSHTYLEKYYSRQESGKILATDSWGTVEPITLGEFLRENTNPNFVLDGNSEENFAQMLKNTPSKSSNSVMLSTVSAVPQSPTDDGTPGDIFLSDDYLYICVGTNSWRRIAVTSW